MWLVWLWINLIREKLFGTLFFLSFKQSMTQWIRWKKKFSYWECEQWTHIVLSLSWRSLWIWCGFVCWRDQFLDLSVKYELDRFGVPTHHARATVASSNYTKNQCAKQMFRIRFVIYLLWYIFLFFPFCHESFLHITNNNISITFQPRQFVYFDWTLTQKKKKPSSILISHRKLKYMRECVRPFVFHRFES